MFKSAVSIMWGNGSYKLMNSEAGMIAVEKVKEIRQSCFVVGIQEPARHLPGNKDHSPGKKERQC